MFLKDLKCFGSMKDDLATAFKNDSTDDDEEEEENLAQSMKQLVAAIKKIEGNNNNNAFCSSTSTMDDGNKNANDDDDAPSYERKLFLPAYKKLKMSIEEKQKEMEETRGEFEAMKEREGLHDLDLEDDYWADSRDEVEDIVYDARKLLKIYENYEQVGRFMAV